jgi:hypothetical protein
VFQLTDRCASRGKTYQDFCIMAMSGAAEAMSRLASNLLVEHTTAAAAAISSTAARLRSSHPLRMQLQHLSLLAQGA